MVIAAGVFIVLAALAAAIGAEFLGWLPVLVRFLVGLAIRQLPAEQRDRYREEFLYDINSKAANRNISALLWAIGACISARGLARTLREQQETGRLAAAIRAARGDAAAIFEKRLANLSVREFEGLVAELFAREGYDVTLRPASSDSGFDFFVSKGTPSGEVLYVVQCKRYSSNRSIGIDQVRQLNGLVERERATGGILVTTSSFSPAALREQSAARFRLSLCDNLYLRRWLRNQLGRDKQD